MLRYKRQHFEALRPYKWRLERMRNAAKPPYEFEYRAIDKALAGLDFAARHMLSPEEYQAWCEPWIPLDHS